MEHLNAEVGIRRCAFQVRDGIVSNPLIDAAEYIGVAPGTIANRVYQGKLVSRKIGRYKAVPKDELDAGFET